VTKQQTIERISQHLAQMEEETLEGLLRFLESLPKEKDETAYLLGNPANARRLLQAVQNVEMRQHLVRKELTDLTRD
jgi:hypothetical protein